MAGPIRQPIDIPALERYIDKHISEIKTPLEILQFGYGQSNPTYLLISSDRSRYVLRKKPPGQLLSKTAHAVEREYRVLRALQNTDVPVPKVYGLCTEREVIGTEWYIMEYLEGRIFSNPSMPGVTLREKRELWKSAVDTLAKLHKVDYKSEKVGLKGYGKEAEFYKRQLNTLSVVSRNQAKTRDVQNMKEVGDMPYFESLIEFFRNYDVKDKATIVHGDYKIDNLIFHPTEARVIAILDWELSTIGHPVSDFCNLTAPYVAAREGIDMSMLGEDTSKRMGKEEFLPRKVEGLPTREEILRCYKEASGWDPEEGGMLDYGDGFAFFRTAVIGQGIMARLALGTASSAKAFEYGNLFPRYASVSWQIVKRLGAKEIGSGKESKL